METITIQGKQYKHMSNCVLSECYDLFDIIQKTELNEYTEYYDKVIFKMQEGVFAAYQNDLSNYWRI